MKAKTHSDKVFLTWLHLKTTCWPQTTAGSSSSVENFFWISYQLMHLEVFMSCLFMSTFTQRLMANSIRDLIDCILTFPLRIPVPSCFTASEQQSSFAIWLMRAALKVLTSQSFIADMSKIVQQFVEVCPKPGAGLKAFLGEITCFFFLKLTFSTMWEKSGNYLLHVIFQGNVF